MTLVLTAACWVLVVVGMVERARTYRIIEGLRAELQAKSSHE